MPPAAAAGAAQGGAQQGGQQQNGVGNFLSGLIRMGMMWYMFNMFKGGGQQPATGPAAAQLKPLYARGEPVDMRVFLYERPYLHDYSKGVLVWQETDIPLGTAKERRLNYTYHPSEVCAGQLALLRGGGGPAAPGWDTSFAAGTGGPTGVAARSPACSCSRQRVAWLGMQPAAPSGRSPERTCQKQGILA